MPPGWRPVWSVWLGVTHHECGCQHQVVPLITELPLSRLGVPVLSLITRCIYSGNALLDFPQMHSVDTKPVLCFPRKVIITIRFAFSWAELGVARWNFEAGIYWISVRFVK